MSDRHGPDAFVLLHGRGMNASDLVPFGAALRLEGRLVCPEGPYPVTLASGVGGRSFWPTDDAAREARLGSGPADLSDWRPPGLDDARASIIRQLDDLQEAGAARVALGGFSQGAMLACDVALRGRRPAALILLSASWIAADEWRPLLTRLAGLPVFQSHGTADPELSFPAAEVLREEVRAAGASVTWVPFDGGHEIPLLVWRALRRFLAAI